MVIRPRANRERIIPHYGGSRATPFIGTGVGVCRFRQVFDLLKDLGPLISMRFLWSLATRLARGEESGQQSPQHPERQGNEHTLQHQAYHLISSSLVQDSEPLVSCSSIPQPGNRWLSECKGNRL
jgi:hypothetical protein